jgi:Predicted membrane protein
MDTRLVLAWLHLLALAIGLSGVWARARALRDSLRYPEDHGSLRRAFVGDTWWGVAAVLWIVTGLWRLGAGTEKNPGYYLVNHVFFVKMGLFLAIVALEVWPMKTLIRWRRQAAVPDPRDAGRIEAISYVQSALVVGMVLAAAAMARGYGAPTTTGASASASSMRQAIAAPVAAPTADTASVPVMTPSGTETVTPADVALLEREIAMPLDAVSPAALHSNFDEQRGGGTRRHEALDIMAPRRTPVKSAAAGRVLKLFTSAAGGLMIYAADSSERFVLMYAHLDGYADGMRDGVPLTRGELIGYVGSTGNAIASAPHLHFAVARSADVKRWSRGKPIDPLPILQAAAPTR